MIVVCYSVIFVLFIVYCFLIKYFVLVYFILYVKEILKGVDIEFRLIGVCFFVEILVKMICKID